MQDVEALRKHNEYLFSELEKKDRRILQLEMHITAEKLLNSASVRRIVERNKDNILKTLLRYIDVIQNDAQDPRPTQDDQLSVQLVAGTNGGSPEVEIES